MNYNNKSEILKRANFLLKDGVKNRESMFHTPIISSFSHQHISSRVMVLRAHNATQRTMRFHSDFRSDKVKEMLDDPRTSIIAYDPSLKTQIRLVGKSKIHHNNKNSLKAWDESQAISKKCYSVKGGSSKVIDDPASYDIKEFNVEDGYQNFAVLVFNFDALEFLFLKSTGHRRAIHKWNKDLKSSWLVP